MPFPTSVVSGLGASLLFLGLWQFERHSHDATRAHLAVVEGEKAALSYALDAERETGRRNADLLARQTEVSDALRSDLLEVSRAQASALAELDTLRKQEHRNALTEPFKRGAAAAARRQRLLCAFFAERGDCAKTDPDEGGSRADTHGARGRMATEQTQDAGHDR